MKLNLFFKKVLIKFLDKINLQIKPKMPLKDVDYLYFLWITDIFSKAIEVPGHIIEVGVADGRNSILFGKLLDITSEKWSRKYYGFDTFQGYPRDIKSKNPWLDLNSWKKNSCKKKNVLQRIRNVGFEDYCELIEGDCRITIKDFLENYSDNRINKGCAVISLLYIDCNAYDPALESMKMVYPYIAPGGLIVIDEKIQGGESQALIKFAEINKLILRHDICGCPAYIRKPLK